MKSLSLALLPLLALTVHAPLGARTQEHGEAGSVVGGQQQVWNTSKMQWMDIESFWQQFAEQNDGKYWGRSDTYPNYDEVNEYDTFLVELAQGTCLMQFFHARWRRANDVQRWDDTFNQYGGCPYVFD